MAEIGSWPLILIWISSLLYFVGESLTEQKTFENATGIDSGKYHGYRVIEMLGPFILLNYLSYVAYGWNGLIFLDLSIIHGLSVYELIWRKITYGGWLKQKGYWKFKLAGINFKIKQPRAEMWVGVFVISTVIMAVCIVN